MNILIKACLLCLMLLLGSVYAADLSSAKQEGWVGEQTNGYLGLVKSDAPGDIKALVSSVNSQRKAQFAQIATKNGIAESEAAKIFAREAASRTASGNYIQNAAGAWVKK